MTRILVLGSEGNIGKPLTKYLRRFGHQVKEADIKPGYRPDYYMVDINQPMDMLEAFDWKPDVVLMLSAMVSRVTCEQAGSLAVATNLTGLQNVLTLCKRINAKVIYFSTSEVYGPACDPMDEAISDPQPNNRYGLTKLLGEKLVEYEVRQSGLRAVTIRPFMMYDEDEHLGDHRSAMIRFAANLAQGKPIEVHRGSERGWIHVSDAVRAIAACMELNSYTIINIGHPDIRPINELAEMIRQRLGAAKDLLVEVDQPVRMTLAKRPTLSRMQKLLGVAPSVSLADGVGLVCARVRERVAETC